MHWTSSGILYMVLTLPKFIRHMRLHVAKKSISKFSHLYTYFVFITKRLLLA